MESTDHTVGTQHSWEPIAHPAVCIGVLDRHEKDFDSHAEETDIGRHQKPKMGWADRETVQTGMTKCWKSGNRYALALGEVGVEEVCCRGRDDNQAAEHCKGSGSSVENFEMAVSLQASEQEVAA